MTPSTGQERKTGPTAFEQVSIMMEQELSGEEPTEDALDHAAARVDRRVHDVKVAIAGRKEAGVMVDLNEIDCDALALILLRGQGRSQPPEQTAS